MLFAASECAPLAKVGGLADVVAALPAELRRRGHDVRVVMPRYRATKAAPAVRLGTLRVPMGPGSVAAAVFETRLERGGVPVYLLACEELFDRDGIYGAVARGYDDNARRFAFLSRATVVLDDVVAFRPHVVHAHDWPTALVPVNMRLNGSAAASVLSIHNLAHQGSFGVERAGELGFGRDAAQLLGVERDRHLNFLRGGIAAATRIATVSPRYAAEVMTVEGGAGLSETLSERRDAVSGILNGIDDTLWDPATDPFLPANYDASSLSGKAVCKRSLQRELGLTVRADAPLFGCIARFVDQKGIDVLARALPALLTLDVQLAVIGAGEPWAERFFARLSATTPNVRAFIGYDEGLAHRIEAGADFFLMPSRYEPCGLNQLYSQRYGTLPIVRAVGGLADSVEHGVTGFSFDALTPEALVDAVGGALAVRRDRTRFAAMQRTAMNKRMGWAEAAPQYEALYRLALRDRPEGG